MKVIYGLFERYTDARDGVEALLDQEYGVQEMNGIVQAQVAQEYMDLDRGSVGAEVTDAVGERTAEGFDPWLAAQTPVSLPVLGQIYAAGDTATTLVRTAIAQGGGTAGLRFALQDFVPPDVAQAFADGVGEGGVLFWIRTGDERGGVAAETLRRHNGQHVADYVG